MEKKNKIKLIIAILISILLISTFLYLFFRTDFFRTKRSAFLRYFENIPEATELIKENDFTEYNNKKKETSYIRKAIVKIQDSNNIANSEILDKIRLEVNEKSDNKNKKSNIEYDFYNGNSKIANISYIQNKNTYGLYSEDVVKGYICADNTDLQRIINDTNGTNYILPNQINLTNIEKILETSKNEKNKIVKLCKMLSNDVSNTAYTKERHNQVTINNKIYTGTAYTLSLNENENAKLEEVLLTQISQDSILMDYITSKAKLIGFENEYSSINDLNKLMKNKAKELQSNPKEAGNLKITVHEFKQENIETEIISGDTKITIQHVKNDTEEYSSIQIGNVKFSIQKTGNYYTFAYNNEDKNIIIDYSQTGSIENNDIKNSMTIKYTSGIKRITYLYNDEINFTNDIGQIKTFDGFTTVKLNNMKDNELKAFMKLLKNRINDVYISKGSSIGINLDPIFVYE